MTRYSIDYVEMNKMICKEYFDSCKHPIITFWVFLGIFFGCDFIRGTCDMLQKPYKKEECTESLFTYWFDKVLKSPNKLVSLKIVEDVNYFGNKRAEIKVNIKGVFEAIESYHDLHNYRMSFEERTKLVAICLNTEYIFGYMANQYRFKKDRNIVRPYCDTKDEDGCDIYGYCRDAMGKIVQSKNLPKKYGDIIYRPF